MLEARITKRVNEEENATKAYAELVVDNCAVIRGVRLMAGKNGAFVSFPQEQAYDAETKAPKLDENGNPVYQDIVFPLSKESRDATVQLLLEAYKSMNNMATMDEAAKGHNISATMYEANGERIKASGSVQVGDFVCRNILVAVRESKQNGELFAAVSYPSYSRETDKGTVYKPYLEFKKDGLGWNEQLQTFHPENYEALARNIVVKAAKEVSPELVAALEVAKDGKDKEKEEKKVNGGKGKGKVKGRKKDVQKVDTEIPLHLRQRGR